MRNSSANSPEDARQLLRKCALFRGLAADQQDVIVARARIRHFIAGQNVFQMGSPGDSMMAVLTGNIRISVPALDGREVLLAILHPGEVFGEIALLDGKERTADAWAITDCKLGILERADVLDFLQRQPNLWESPRFDPIGICSNIRDSHQSAERALHTVITGGILADSERLVTTFKIPTRIIGVGGRVVRNTILKRSGRV
jgi:hypothetical protein